MAIISPSSTRCSICGEILQAEDNIISWKAFLNPDHPLWKFSDSAMHQSCFEAWEHKDEFEMLYAYQPLINFDDPALQANIQKYGMPDWLKEIKEFRERNNFSETDFSV